MKEEYSEEAAAASAGMSNNAESANAAHVAATSGTAKGLDRDEKVKAVKVEAEEERVVVRAK